MHVRQPFTVATTIVTVEHRGDGIHPQTIDTKGLEPVQRAAEQEISDLRPIEIVDQGVPVWMKALTPVGIFVEWRAVEPCKTVGIARKMRRNPIDYDTEPGVVTGSHETPERCRIAMSRGWGI